MSAAKRRRLDVLLRSRPRTRRPKEPLLDGSGSPLRNGQFEGIYRDMPTLPTVSTFNVICTRVVAIRLLTTIKISTSCCTLYRVWRATRSLSWLMKEVDLRNLRCVHRSFITSCWTAGNDCKFGDSYFVKVITHCCWLLYWKTKLQ